LYVALCRSISFHTGAKLGLIEGAEKNILPEEGGRMWWDREDIHNLCYTPNIITSIKEDGMGREGNVA
jgi:hypothetical protein